MKIAFATSDNQSIDQHFGWSTQFAIWEVGADVSRFLSMVDIEPASDHEDDKIDARLKRLGDCTIVYVTEIGGPAAARLVANRIHPVKSRGHETIREVIGRLQAVLANNPPPWLRRAMQK
ncbi:nitrogen fixation protein NifX [Syntrophotalea acetylenica]|uniref:nitrogen fixation protein NifX n=1 Tax=Syntrophotalea acetylenica TaxID=29542 RepID=UPI002A360F3D|nr:nitrogen fixation protein NifX [Syntrophotalea acetylenica]MDY0263090.1 nitrogen fixation protein NifX [Syntrophotalea acetylenica]